MKCKYCNNTAHYYPCNPKTGKCENVCKICLVKMKPIHKDLVDFSKVKKCEQCGTETESPIIHHTCYFPEMKILICRTCHNKIHKKKKDDEAKIFYGDKR